MEDHLVETLNLPAGAKVLDAGCGVGHVAMHLARKGLRVQGIDVVDRHIQKAQRYIQADGLEGRVKVRKMDYHHLDEHADKSFDGVYTMETFVHATEPEKALSEFFRVLKPGGKIALYEYDHVNMYTAPDDLRESMDQINLHAAMPTNVRFDEGVLQRMLEDTGFEDVHVKDLSVNIRPLLRLFFIIAFLPFLLIRFLGLQACFVNTMSGVEGHRGRNYWRYVAVSAKKPSGGMQDVDGVREGKKLR
ncbi:hypothetical protein H2201_001700 [Coniosporium apollinis]|uniref:Methyltransferase type 11 domain-containing protein n=2 Tax=Coniosporium TaxID=2810619 RepID=A0ABQ9P114_9PEZI|nr:hypothetical protein H2199_007589 [Cladosporium sp. JES 115]KAJ9668270.1 hypothetical protein H2201_001700 [Coniosporium apollinis]